MLCRRKIQRFCEHRQQLAFVGHENYNDAHKLVGTSVQGEQAGPMYQSALFVRGKYHCFCHSCRWHTGNFLRGVMQTAAGCNKKHWGQKYKTAEPLTVKFF